MSERGNVIAHAKSTGVTCPTCQLCRVWMCECEGSAECWECSIPLPWSVTPHQLSSLPSPGWVSNVLMMFKSGAKLVLNPDLLQSVVTGMAQPSFDVGLPGCSDSLRRRPHTLRLEKRCLFFPRMWGFLYRLDCLSQHAAASCFSTVASK